MSTPFASRRMRTLVTNAELLCRIERAFASRLEFVCACADVAGRVQRRARIASGRSVCVRACDRLERVIGTRVESRSGGARALRYAMKRPRNRVERSTPLTIDHYARVKESRVRSVRLHAIRFQRFSYEFSRKFVLFFFWKNILGGAFNGIKIFRALTSV